MRSISCDIQCRLEYNKGSVALPFKSQKNYLKTALKCINIIYLEQWPLPAK